MPFKQGPLSSDEVRDLNEMASDIARLKQIKVSPPLKLNMTPSGWNIESPPISSTTPSNSEIKVTGALVTGPLDYYPGTLETTTDGIAWTSGSAVRLVNTGATVLVNGQRYTTSYIGTISGNAYYATRDNDSASGFGTHTAQYLTDATIACVAGTVTITITKDSSRNFMTM